MTADVRNEGHKIGLRDIRALAPNSQIFDAGPGAVPAFGVRRRTGPSVSYFVLFRTVDGRWRRYTIGTHGAPWTPDKARDKAREILSEVRMKGADPAADKQAKRKAETVNDLLDLYWHDAETGNLMTRRRTAKKASTLRSDRGRIDKHIRPILGAMKVAAVTPRDIEMFMRAVEAGKTAARKPTGKPRGLSNVRGGRGVATRATGLLGGIFSYAIRRGLRLDNPVHGIMRPADGKRERRLTDQEYKSLGEALRQAAAQHVWPAAVAAMTFLAISGWRSGEVLNLRWSEVNLPGRTAILSDSKTGRSMRPLSRAACEVLRGQGQGASDALVFAASRGDGRMSGFRSFWNRVARLGEFAADITPHTLRHSYASLASDMGFSELTIAALIGHAGNTITSRYVHSADTVLLNVADRVANETAFRMGETRVADEVPLSMAG